MFILGRMRVGGTIGDPVPLPQSPQKLPPPYDPATGESLLHKPHRPDDVLVRRPTKRRLQPPTREELEELIKKRKVRKKKS